MTPGHYSTRVISLHYTGYSAQHFPWLGPDIQRKISRGTGRISSATFTVAQAGYSAHFPWLGPDI
jgi:hypothetical protein